MQVSLVGYDPVHADPEWVLAVPWRPMLACAGLIGKHVVTGDAWLLLVGCCRLQRPPRPRLPHQHLAGRWDKGMLSQQCGRLQLGASKAVQE